MKNKMVDLRNHLFATIEALLDGDKDMDAEKAAAIADVGRVLVDSARAENELLIFMRKNPHTVEFKGSGFMEIEGPEYLRTAIEMAKKDDPQK